MKRILAVVFVATLFALPALSQRGERPIRGRPNLIIILVDDMGYMDLGCYWDAVTETVRPDRRPHELPIRIDTPEIDKMASEGVMFTDFLVGASVCSASRAALLTGCYPPRVGLSSGDDRHTGALHMSSRVGLNPDEVTIAEVLKERGYATACIGKWHLGNRKPFLPTRHGFDSYYGPMFLSAKRPIFLMQDEEEAVDTLQVAYLTDRYTQKAVEFIREHKDEPFFLYLAHNMPHTPLGTARRFRGQSERGLYGDVVMNIDWSTGHILQTLENLQLSRRTLVIFLSDNGPWIAKGQYGGNSEPLRGGKGYSLEGGFRVPCIMWWPGRIEPRVCDELATALDIMPTLAWLANAKMPVETDGVNIGSLLFEPNARSPRDLFYYYDTDSLKAVRSGKWKLTFNEPASPGGPAVLGPLYDLRTDLAEMVDQSQEHPEVVKRLSRKADLMRKELGDLMTGTQGTGRREPGRVGRPQNR